MRHAFVKTKNVTAITDTVDKLRKKEAGVPGLALIHGQRGLGKTEAVIALAGEHDAIYVMAKKEWTYGWMMEDLSVELGIVPQGRKKAQWDAVINALVDQPRIMIVDEINLPPIACLETLRGINDSSKAPILMVGHEGVCDRLRRLGPLWDRLLYITEVQPLDIDDLRLFAESCVELPVTEDVLRTVLAKSTGNFRRSVVMLKGLEDRAKLALAVKIEARHLKAA